MTTAYLRADPELRRAWRERIALSGACRVGLVWAGNPENDRDHLRSLRAESFRPVLAEPGFQFYSLQVGPQGRQARPLEGADLIDLTSHIVDFADTAALVAELDLVITVDTAIAHLAGAMAKPVWTMLPFVPDWRWRMDGDATPWYPTMRLFRQPTLGDWDAVIKRIAAELRLLRSMAGNHPP
jgi:ADP-heptose:LPS heptosyltransferase